MHKLRKMTIVYLVLITAYVVLSWLQPVDADTLTRYNLSELRARFLSLTLIIPLTAIWLVAYYGYTKFEGYSKLIRTSGDGRGFRYIARGLGVFAFGLPVSALIELCLSLIGEENDTWIAATTIIDNYLAIAVAGLAFYFIHKGTSKLTRIIKNKQSILPYSTIAAAIYGLLGATYAYTTLQNPIRSAASEAGQRATYYLSDWLILLTIILPYLIIWFMGIRSVLQLRYYQSQVSGVIYKKVLQLLTYGIGFVVITSIIIQYLTSTSASLLNLDLSDLLLFIYLLLIVFAGGYVMIALGANKLRQLEEV